MSGILYQGKKSKDALCISSIAVTNHLTYGFCIHGQRSVAFCNVIYGNVRVNLTVKEVRYSHGFLEGLMVIVDVCRKIIVDKGKEVIEDSLLRGRKKHLYKIQVYYTIYDGIPCIILGLVDYYERFGLYSFMAVRFIDWKT